MPTLADLLITGLRVAQLGSSALYATCLIDGMQNDGVVNKLVANAQKEDKKAAKRSVKVRFRSDTGDTVPDATLVKE